MLKGSLPNANLPSANVSSSSVMDVQSLQKIKSLGKSDSAEAVKAVAQQFESYFVHQMLKTMRASVDVLSEGNYLRSNTTDFHQSMLDQQWAQSISEGQGMGLADVLAQQLQSQYRAHLSGHERQPSESLAGPSTLEESSDDADIKKALAARRLSLTAVQPEKKVEQTALTGAVESSLPSEFHSPEAFVEALMPLAERAAKKLKTQPDVILAQAALETGWGKSVIKNDEGSSHNLFNIKADHRWQGEKIAVTTLEFDGASATKVTAPFRSYASWEQSFEDYVDFLTSQPRYQSALQYSQEPERFIQELQRAGYATDPEYARKIERVRQGTVLNQG